MLKPYDSPTITDNFYLNESNKVKKAIIKSSSHDEISDLFDEEDIEELAIFLTSYFEDLISDTNLWNTFINQHKLLFGKPLPFFDTSNYFEEEINPQDIAFLIWYFLNGIQDEHFISPFSGFILKLSDEIMEVFDHAWEEAPQNQYLKTFYHVDENEDDFYEARALMDIVLFQSYLFYPDTQIRLIDSEIDIIEDEKNIEYKSGFLKDNRDRKLQSLCTRLLAFTAKEWVSKLLGTEHKLAQEYIKISPRIFGSFLYKGQDKNDIFIEHIASGKEFNLTKKSFDNIEILKDIDTIMVMSIVLWKNEWWFTGIYMQYPFNADTVLDEKNSLIKRKEVDFLDYESKDVKSILKLHLEVFKEFNGGAQIAFLPTTAIEDFTIESNKYYSKSLKLTKQEETKAKQRAKDTGYFGGNKTSLDYTDLSDTSLVFFNPNSGIEYAFHINSAFPMDHNPFFEINESGDALMNLLMSKAISKELVEFCLENCKSKLPFFKEGLGHAFLPDMDFMLRFWKMESYHSKPTISFI